MTPRGSTQGGVSARSATLFQEAQTRIHRRADRLFACLMILQWLAGIVAALWISPKTWDGVIGRTHWHVWTAVFLGGAITAFPALLAWRHPGRTLTRHVIAVGQTLTSALLIHLTGGRIETHFHVFGSLAFLAFYRDWRVLVTATVVVAADHFLRGVYWPQSAYGALTVSPWRWFEHAGWVIFEDTFLLISMRQSLADMIEVAERRARLEEVNANIEHQVAERTSQLTRENAERRSAQEALRKSEAHLQTVLENLTEGVAVSDLNGQLLHLNRAALRMHGYGSLQECRRHLSDFADTFELASLDGTVLALDQWPLARVLRGEELRGQEVRVRRFDADWERIFRYTGTLVHDDAGQPLLAVVMVGDVTEPRRAQAEVEKMHQELLEASRQAGMAEVATGVLHNVGNVLNSVNVSASCLTEQARKAPVDDLARLVALLREQGDRLSAFFTHDPRGRKAVEFLAQVADKFARQRDAQLKELASLARNIEHIKDIVAMQQSYAKVSGVTETLRVADLVEDALRMNAGSFQRHEVDVAREIAPDLPPITTDKHKVLQILVNLVRNAKHACDDSGRKDKRITVRVRRGEGRVRIEVADNGVGIPPENLTRIFNHGFTTKKDGHGFGLHSGANAARELGGSLTALSDGPGRGATFKLELPLHNHDTVILTNSIPCAA